MSLAQAIAPHPESPAMTNPQRFVNRMILFLLLGHTVGLLTPTSASKRQSSGRARRSIAPATISSFVSC